MEWMMKIVAKDVKLSTEETETEKSIALVKGLENNVNRKKGKGIKSRSCIKVVKNVQKIDSLPIKHLETEEGEAPYVVVFLDQEGNTLCSHVIGDGRKIIGQTLNVLDSLLLLIAVYYVFDLDYPEIYSQTLGILQQWAIGDQYTQQMFSKYVEQWQGNLQSEKALSGADPIDILSLTVQKEILERDLARKILDNEKLTLTYIMHPGNPIKCIRFNRGKEADIRQCEDSILQFCKDFEAEYCQERVTPNMHLHFHLSDCLNDYGPVYSSWLFSFERYNGHLGSLPKYNRSIELQRMRRFTRDSFVNSVQLPAKYESTLFKHFQQMEMDTLGAVAAIADEESTMYKDFKNAIMEGRRKYTKSLKVVADFEPPIKVEGSTEMMVSVVKKVVFRRLHHCCGRYLLLNYQPIVWDHFEEAFKFNQSGGFRIHRHLKKKHRNITVSLKMSTLELLDKVLCDDTEDVKSFKRYRKLVQEHSFDQSFRQSYEKAKA
ncbi:unnamed protein product [Mytilus edulis]|uniref:Uncharacterized protein n=1 Tax=Mytilus edulis TaxID=6550 RepID=A0A8S3R1H9_MYTED|nr:unnamed protein product [Mytilus edulis]